MLAVVLCGAIFLISQLFLEPPQPETPPDGVAGDAIAETEDSAREKARAEAPVEREAVEDPAAGTGEAKVEQRTIQTELLALAVGNRDIASGGLVEGVRLRSAQFEGHATATNPLFLGEAPTLAIDFADAETDFRVPRGAAYALRESGELFAEFAYTGNDVEVVQRLELLQGYQGLLQVSVTNKSGASQQHRLHVRTRVGTGEGSRYDIHRGLCRLPDDLEVEDASDVEDEAIAYSGAVRWVGVDSKYFATLVVPVESADRCEIALHAEQNALETDMTTSTVVVEPGETHTHRFGVYVGPKELDRLKGFSAVPLDPDHDLEKAIDWGYLGFISEWLGKLLLVMLRWFHELTTSWGLAIVLLTVVVKLVTLPLTLKQMSSMKAMKRIQPEMQRIKEKYKDDSVKQGQEMQALFARSGVNPLAGCLPLLVQLPIWVALYAMLGAVVELVHVPFLWLPDLTEQDPYYVLPLAIGAMMVVQNRMMPMTGDEAQAQMMRWVMPVMFTAFMLFLPSGLGVYIFVNIVLSVLQTAFQVGRSDAETETPAPAK